MQVLLIYALGIGIWGLEVVRAEVACDPPPVYNKTVIASGHDREEYPLGSNVTYRCDFGYASDVVIGSSRCVLSKSNGRAEWTEPLIRCKPRSCGDPGFVSNARRLGSLFTFPNSVQYECEDGYEIHGLSTRYCLASGSWSGTLPTCKKIHCGFPANPQNGQAIYSSTEYEAEVKYRCNAGYSLSNKQPRFCTGDGTWSGVEPVCTEGLCEAPVAPENGKIVIKPSVPRIGSIVSYACHEGFRLQGSESSRCLETGVWTFPAPKCLHPCKIPDSVPHGKIGVYKTSGYYRQTAKFETISRGTSIKDGKFVLRCDNKYKVTGTGEAEGIVECRGGEWSDNLKCVPASCKSSPPSTSNGRVTRLSREHGGTVVYSCNSDYLKTKSGNVTCHFGTWTGITPVCTDTRCRIDELSFPGLVPGKPMFQDGESFLPSCEKGYRVARPEASRLSCRQGTWIGHMPPCTGERCKEPPPSIPNGHVVHFTGEHASIARYECKEFYNLQQSQNTQVQCLFGEWKGRLPECKDSRCHLKDLRKKMGVSTESREVTNHNEYLDVVCGSEYTPTGERPFCFEGKWNERVLSPCQEKTCEISAIRNGVLTERRLGPKYLTWNGWVRDDIYEEIPVGTEIWSGHTRHLTCYDGYSVQGSGSSVLLVTCQKGKWYPSPVCLPHGTAYVEEVVTAASTSKPSVPRNVVAAEVPSTESNLKFSKTTTQPPTSSSTDGGEAGQPHGVPVAENNNVAEPCYCEYNSPDKNLVAYAGNELLQNGHKVKFNCTVNFHCKEIGYYRLTGPKKMTCTDCRPFHSAAYPECKEPVHGDTAIFFDENLKVTPDGTLSLKQGVTVRLTCIGNIRYPDWTFPESKNVHTYYEALNTDDGIVYSSLLDIVEPSSKHDGKYSCAMEGYAPTTINIKVFEDLCEPPVAPENGMIVIKPSVPRIGSIVSYACQDGFRLQGVQSARCLETLEWTFSAPKCLRKRLNSTRCYLKDLRMKMGVSAETSEVTNHNEYLDVVCDSEYTPTGERPFCFEGNWNERVLSPCRERRCEVSRIYNGVLTGRPLGTRYWTKNGRVRDDVFEEIPVGTEISSGNTRHLQCFDGYSVQGRGSSVLPITCQKGKWYPHPVCLPHGTTYVEGGITAASPSKPSVPRTVAVAEVLSTEPNLKFPKTTKQPPTSSSADGDGSCEISRIHNGEITERHLGPRYLTWKGYEQDDVYEQIPVGTEISSGHTRHLTCFDGYSVQGTGLSVLLITCQKGKWYPQPVCLPHGTVYVEEGATAASTSKPSVPSTVAVAEVSSNLKLSKTKKQPPTSSSTHGISGCGPIPKADNSQLIIEPEKEFYVFGESAKFSCPPGHTLTSELQLAVCISNTWSTDEFPDCKNV